MPRTRLTEILAALAALGPRARGHRYPAELRDEIVAWVHAERRRGRAWHELSARLGLRPTTLQRWFERPSESTRARPVVVRAEAAEPTRLALVGPAGWRIEGLSLDDARQLLAALAC